MPRARGVKRNPRILALLRRFLDRVARRRILSLARCPDCALSPSELERLDAIPELKAKYRRWQHN
jgi:hypothetical protein